MNRTSQETQIPTIYKNHADVVRFMVEFERAIKKRERLVDPSDVCSPWNQWTDRYIIVGNPEAKLLHDMSRHNSFRIDEVIPSKFRVDWYRKNDIPMRLCFTTTCNMRPTTKFTWFFCLQPTGTYIFCP